MFADSNDLIGISGNWSKSRSKTQIADKTKDELGTPRIDDDKLCVYIDSL